MTNQNQVAQQLSAAIDTLTTNMAEHEKRETIESAADMFQARLEAKLSQARSEALVEIRDTLVQIATQHKQAVSEKLASKVIEVEKENQITELPELDWSLPEISRTHILEEARNSENNMRLIESSDSEFEDSVGF